MFCLFFTHSVCTLVIFSTSLCFKGAIVLTSFLPRSTVILTQFYSLYLFLGRPRHFPVLQSFSNRPFRPLPVLQSSSYGWFAVIQSSLHHSTVAPTPFLPRSTVTVTPFYDRPHTVLQSSSHKSFTVLHLSSHRSLALSWATPLPSPGSEEHPAW